MLVAQAVYAAEYFLDRKFEDAPAEIRRITAALRRDMLNIALIGMPSCGKTTLGRMLAKSLGRTFVDLDEEIVKTAGRSIPDIFGLRPVCRCWGSRRLLRPDTAGGAGLPWCAAPVEVMLDAPDEREPFRKTDVVSFGCQGHFIGEGPQGYLHACIYLAQLLRTDGSSKAHIVM